jgi:aromatic ring-opening dioxygenase catalytic subunit (LigB family)
MPASPSRLPTYYLTHGGGPWPWMKPEVGHAYDQMEASLQAVRRELDERPKAVLMVTAHWETNEFAVSSGERPGMVYDYYGFPERLYHIRYDAPGAPALAARVQALLQAGGLPCDSDPERGFDHGAFSLMKPLYPEEAMPLVQLSIRRDYDPATHIAAGRLLAPLRDEGVVIIGSGSSFHDLRNRGPAARAPSGAFDAWLQDTLLETAPGERLERLAHWTQAPAARLAHPHEDHLIPLMVALGAAEDEAAACVYHEDGLLGGWTVSSFRFGPAWALTPEPA